MRQIQTHGSKVTTGSIDLIFLHVSDGEREGDAFAEAGDRTPFDAARFAPACCAKSCERAGSTEFGRLQPAGCRGVSHALSRCMKFGPISKPELHKEV